jgi:hypothetical protein
MKDSKRKATTKEIGADSYSPLFTAPLAGIVFARTSSILFSPRQDWAAKSGPFFAKICAVSGT